MVPARIVLDQYIGRFVADVEALYSYEGTREMNSLIVGRAITGFSAFVQPSDPHGRFSMNPLGRLIVRAEEIRTKITANAPLASRFSLEAVPHDLGAGTPAGWAVESVRFAICALSGDGGGSHEILQKRAPKFMGA